MITIEILNIEKIPASRSHHIFGSGADVKLYHDPNRPGDLSIAVGVDGVHDVVAALHDVILRYVAL